MCIRIRCRHLVMIVTKTNSLKIRHLKLLLLFQARGNKMPNDPQYGESIYIKYFFLSEMIKNKFSMRREKNFEMRSEFGKTNNDNNINDYTLYRQIENWEQ